MAISEMDATVRLAFLASAGPRGKSCWGLFRRSDAENTRMATLAGAVDRKSYRRNMFLQAAVCLVIFAIGVIPIMLVGIGLWSVIEFGLIDPALIADNAWVVSLVSLVLLAANGMAVLIACVMLPPRLVAARPASAAMRAKLVPQPGDSALLARCERENIMLPLLGFPLAVVIGGLVVLLMWLATSDWIAGAQWLMPGLILALIPLFVIQARRMIIARQSIPSR